jgi:hypothetical protein
MSSFPDPRVAILLFVGALIYTTIWLVLLLLARIIKISDRRAFVIIPFIVFLFLCLPAMEDKHTVIFYGGLAVASAVSSLVPFKREN